jgi:hypothetical protein
VPADVGEVHGDPCDARAGKPVARVMQDAGRKEGPQRADDGARQAAQHGDNRRAKHDKRRCNGHEHEMLRHVHEQQGFRKSIERRSDRDEDGKDTAKKREQAPDGQLRWAGPVDAIPASDVDNRCDRERRSDVPGDIPRGEERIEVHGAWLLAGGG